MQRTVLIALLLATVAAPEARAQRQVTPPAGLEDVDALPPDGVAVSKQGRIVMSPDLCAKLAHHGGAVPGAEYRPGVDVNGDAVAPADLPGDAPAPGIEHLPIVIGGNLQKRYGVAANSPLFRGKSMMGTVTLRDGHVYFNGEPLHDNEREMMLAACREAKR